MDKRETLIQEGLTKLPVFSQAALQALDLIGQQQRPDILEALERAVLTDPLLAGQLLKVANSPFFGFSRTIASVKEAIQLVGLNTLQSLVLAVHSRQLLSTMEDADALIVGRIWRFDLLSALISREISTGSTLCPSTLFMISLFKNFGLSLMLAQKPSLIPVVESPPETLDAIHQRLIEEAGIHPYEYSALILEHWRFPPLLVELLQECSATTGSAGAHHTYLSVLQFSEALASAKEPIFPARTWRTYQPSERLLGVDLKDILAGTERAHRLAQSFNSIC